MAWTLIHIIDWTLWLFLAGSVVYVCFFAIISLLPHWHKRTVTSGEPAYSRFLVLFPAYKEDAVVCHSVESFLEQDYPQQYYQVAVISDNMQADTNARLSSLPITLLQPSFKKSSKAKALQFAIQHFSSLQSAASQEEAVLSFTHVVILDADNVAGHDFLRQLNIECQKGYDAIQCHRTAKNSNNHIAALDGVSEEINNTLFRKAHNIIGLSSALIGSGMCFNYQWFSQHVSCLNSAVEDRELEALLMQQGIFIKYADKLLVMDEKVCSHDNFQRQRLRWMTGQLQALLSMLPYLPKAFLKGNINYIDKTIQQMLIPRSILLILIPIMALLMTLLNLLWSVKWWLMLVCFSLALFISIPAKLRSRSLLGSLTALPHLAWRMLSNIGHMDRNNTDFIHTSHGADNK